PCDRADPRGGAERSRLLDVRGYRVDLDVTGGGETFGSVTLVRFGCRAPGAGSFIELSPARLRRAVLNGREVDPATLTGNRLPLPGLRETNELRVEADMPIRSAARWPGTASVTWSRTVSFRRGSTWPWPRATCPPG